MPGVVSEDGEVCGEIGGGGRQGRWRGGGFGEWRKGEEFENLDWTCAADGEGFDDELTAELEAFDVGGGFEGEVGGLFGWGRVLVFLLFVFVFVFLVFFLFHFLSCVVW